MNTLKKYTPFFASTLLMYIVLFIIYPHYQYYIDPDGTAYLTVSQRYANGDYAKAINGYWSPWSCWLTALLVKGGVAVISASWLINILGATGFLYISQSFFLRFNIISKLQWLFTITLAFFLCYAIFGQSFDDLWECFFLLAALRIMLAEKFVQTPALWFAMGITGTLAYFAKAYSFPFFILNTICCIYFICKDNKAQWLKISFITIITMIVCSLPWIITLHTKYGLWTTSTAGTLNMSWYLVGHPHWKEGINILIPPAYPDSPYYWEDPWFANGDTPHFWDSLTLFGSLILRAGYHILLLFLSLLQLSVFMPVIAIIALLSFLLRKVTPVYSRSIKVVALSFLLFPIGYVFINFEPRYIWYMVPLSMLLGGFAVQNNTYKFKLPPAVFKIIFPLTYLLLPIWGLINMYDRGRQEHILAGQLTAANIHGAFTGNIHPRSMSKLAYFSGNQYYCLLSHERYNGSGLMDELHRYKVNYYIHGNTTANAFFNPPDQSEIFNDSTFLSENKERLTEIKIEGINSIKIYRVNPL